jgi:hypothetical protein
MWTNSCGNNETADLDFAQINVLVRVGQWKRVPNVDEPKAMNLPRIFAGDRGKEAGTERPIDFGTMTVTADLPFYQFRHVSL